MVIGDAVESDRVAVVSASGALMVTAGALTDIVDSVDTLSAKLPSVLATDRLKVDGSGVTQPVSAASLPLPAGAATEAELDAQTALLTTIDADTSRIPALGQATMANSVPVAIASNQGAVPISAASLPLPTGAATQATLSTMSSALSNIDSSTSSLLSNVDGAATLSDSGAAALVIRDDALTTLTPVDGDYERMRVDSVGRLWTNPSGVTQPVSGTFWQATQPVSGTVTANAGTGTQAVSLAALPALVAGSANIGDVDVLTVPADPFGTNADVGASAGGTGSIQAKLRLATLQLDGIKVAAETIDNAIAGSEMQVDVVAALPAGTNNIGDVDVLTVPADPFGANADASSTAGGVGSMQAKLRLMTTQLDGIKVATQLIDDAISGTEMQVDVVAALPAGTNAIGKLAANSGVDIGDTDVTSVIPGTGATNLGKAVDSAGAGTDTGIAMLGLREDALVTITPADGDYARFKMDSLGKQWVNTGISPELHVSKSFNATTTQTGIDVWDPGAGKKIAVVSVVIGTYGTTAARVILWFGDNADTTFTAGTDQVLLAASFAPSATAKPGLVFTPSMPVICNTADRELHVTTDAGISLDITVSGFEFS